MNPVHVLTTRSKGTYVVVYVGPRQRGMPKPPTIVDYAGDADEARRKARDAGSFHIARPIVDGEVIVPEDVLAS